MATNLYSFYQSVIDQELVYYSYDEDVMEMATDILLASYSVTGLDIPDSLDFDRKDLRCAYLHLFATSHSHMVLDALDRLNGENCTYLLNLIYGAGAGSGSLNVTSLGGGPGSDPLGVLLFLDRAGYLDGCPSIRVHLVDKYRSWKQTFARVLDRYAGRQVTGYFAEQDLLEPLSATVQRVLEQTHLLTMTKFISAVSGDKYGLISSLTQIFNHLRPGALILIIDNAGGKDFRQALDYALLLGLEKVMDPLQHYDFKVPRNLEPRMGQLKYGKRAQTSSRISVVFLKKPQRLSSLANPLSTWSSINSRQAQVLENRRTPVNSNRNSGGSSGRAGYYGANSSVLDRLALAPATRSGATQQPRTATATQIRPQPTQSRPQATTNTARSPYSESIYSDPWNSQYLRRAPQASASAARYASYSTYREPSPPEDEGWSCSIL